MDKARNTGRLGTILNDKTFFLFNIKKNNFIGTAYDEAQGSRDLVMACPR
jgi:hypothetical protein